MSNSPASKPARKDRPPEKDIPRNLTAFLLFEIPSIIERIYTLFTYADYSPLRRIFEVIFAVLQILCVLSIVLKRRSFYFFFALKGIWLNAVYWIFVAVGLFPFYSDSLLIGFWPFFFMSLFAWIFWACRERNRLYFN